MLRLLCLIAALTGGPLRHAEAADDLAREFDEPAVGHVLGELDGGVGDDSGSTILRAVDQVAPAFDAITPVPMIGPLPIWSEIVGTVGPPPDDPAHSPRRHAWLQRFLF